MAEEQKTDSVQEDSGIVLNHQNVDSGVGRFEGRADGTVSNANEPAEEAVQETPETPAEEKPEIDKEDRFDKNPRFQKLITERNEFKEELKAMKAQMEQLNLSRAEQRDIGVKLAELTSLEPDVAKKMVDLIKEEIRSEFTKDIDPLRQQLTDRQVKDLFVDLKAEYPDAEKYMDKMNTIFDELPDVMKDAIRKSGLGMLYKIAKAESAFNDGKEEAIKGKKAKVEGADIKGKASGKVSRFKYTKSQIDAMPIEEYATKEKEIDKALASGNVDMEN